MKEPSHVNVILVRSLAPTDTLGARIKLTDGLMQTSHIIPYNYTVNNAEQGALVWLASHDIHPSGRASISKDSGESLLIISPIDSRRAFELFRRK
jgi:hypothetical protein